MSSHKSVQNLFPRLAWSHSWYIHITTTSNLLSFVGVEATKVTSVDPAHSGSVKDSMTTTQSGSTLTITPVILSDEPPLTQSSKMITIVEREAVLVSWSLARNVIWLASVPKHLKMESDMWCCVRVQLGQPDCSWCTRVCCTWMLFCTGESYYRTRQQQ